MNQSLAPESVGTPSARKSILASFDEEEQLIEAVRAVVSHGWEVADIHAPYFVHGLEDVLGWRRSRLPVVCFLCGATGAAFAFWLQFWTTAENWPIDVGGRPWNSLPAFVPVAFECMVLLAGFGLVFAFLFRARLYPGKSPHTPMPDSTDDRFALIVRETKPESNADEVIRLLQECGATILLERSQEGRS